MRLPLLRSTLIPLGISLTLCGTLAGQEDPMAAPGGDVFGAPRGAQGGLPAAGGFGQGGFGAGPVEGQLSREDLAKQAEEIRNEAKTLADQKDWAGAIAQYNQALQVSRSDPATFMGLADIYRELGFQDLETQNLRAAASALQAQRASASDIYFRLAKLSLEQKQYRPAIDYFTVCLQENPTNPEYMFEYGLAQAIQGYNSNYGAAARESLEAAIASFTNAIRLKPDYADAYFERGNALLRMNQLDDAIDDLEKATKLAPERSEVTGKVGFARLQRASSESLQQNGKQLQINEDYRRSIEALTAFLAVTKPESKKSDPPETRGQETPDERNKILKENAHAARALAYIGLAEEGVESDSMTLYANAISDCDEAILLEPRLATAYLQRGVAQRLTGRLDEAIDSFTEAVQRGTQDQQTVATAMLRRGITLFHLGNLNLASADFETLYDATRDPRAGFWLGLCQAKEGKHAEAVMSYNSVLQDQPDFVLAYLNRGISQLKLGRYTRAVEDFNQVILHDRHHADANAYRSMALERLARR